MVNPATLAKKAAAVLAVVGLAFGGAWAALGALGGEAMAAGSRPRFQRPGKRVARAGDEIVVCGQLFHTGTRVVTWMDAGGYDANRPFQAFGKGGLPTRPATGCETPTRLGRGRRLAPEARALLPDAPPGTVEVDLRALQAQVTQFVVHYDVAYTSANCFRVLHDRRGLSVHFLLDLDGTLYQTCDLRERARHAGNANDRSVGVEIAHPGPLSGQPKLEALYKRGPKGTIFDLPDWIPRGGLAVDKVRLARPDPVRGVIQGREIEMYDYTDAQYEALAHLLAALHKALPRIRLDAPRDDKGKVVSHALKPAALAAFEGIVGHYHVTKRKIDPGPAFDWKRFLRRARRLAR